MCTATTSCCTIQLRKDFGEVTGTSFSTAMEGWNGGREKIVEIGRAEGRPALTALLDRMDDVPKDVIYEDGMLILSQ